MDFELKPLTEAGRHFVALAEEHAADFATRADQHDRDDSFPFENIQALQRSGVMAACVPEELGGLGVESARDYVIGINRLGRGDGSTTIGANMHIFRPWWITRAWKAAKAAGDKQQADKSEQSAAADRGQGSRDMCPPVRARNRPSPPARRSHQGRGGMATKWP